jgi:hypothetical protein
MLAYSAETTWRYSFPLMSNFFGGKIYLSISSTCALPSRGGSLFLFPTPLTGLTGRGTVQVGLLLPQDGCVLDQVVFYDLALRIFKLLLHHHPYVANKIFRLLIKLALFINEYNE